MIKNRTYKNFVSALNKIQAKGYDKDEAYAITDNIFKEFEANPLGLSIEVRINRVMNKSDFDALYGRR